MSTDQKVAGMLAKYLRAAVNRIRGRAVHGDGSVRLPANDYSAGLVTIDQVATELEQVAATPEGTHGT